MSQGLPRHLLGAGTQFSGDTVSTLKEPVMQEEAGGMGGFSKEKTLEVGFEEMIR